jgi:hypothetical protein
MADMICGQPTNLTTVSNGTGGNIRVTLAPWELDWEWFDLIAVGHWLANTTTAVSDDIVAKGGTEATGYWFEISTAFPDANWNSGDRICPQRQAAINQFATFALAFAAMANNDFLLVWYCTATNRRSWSGGLDFNAKGGSIWGMLSRKQLIISCAITGIRYAGNLAGMNIQSRVVNLSFCSYGLNSFGVYNQPTLGFNGAGVRVSRCLIFSATNGLWNSSNATANVVQFDNCILLLCAVGIFLGSKDLKVYSHTVSFCAQGYNGATAGAPSAGKNNNNVALECSVCFTGAGMVNSARNCADTDGTLPVDATNLRNQDARTQLQTFFDLASPGAKKFPPDFRIHHDSVLAGAGLAIAGLPRDADGQLRPDPPSIGAYEPCSTAYAPGAQIVRGAQNRGATP